jgi:hypothetical protein
MLAHVVLAVANDLFSVRAHPDMEFVVSFRESRESRERMRS